jgi:hypothetical protein
VALCSSCCLLLRSRLGGKRCGRPCILAITILCLIVHVVPLNLQIAIPHAFSPLPLTD